MSVYRGRRTGKTINELSEVTLPFGKHKGEKFDDVPLDYLDWMMGNCELRSPFNAQLADYLEHPVHQEELNREED